MFWLLAFFAGIVYSKAKTMQQKALAAQTNPAANDYQQVDPDSDKRDDDTILPIAMTNLEKKSTA